MIGISVVLGFFAFIVLGSIVAVLAAILGLRMWWLNRKLRGKPPQSPGDAAPGGVIEGEYRVVDEDHHVERKP